MAAAATAGQRRRTNRRTGDWRRIQMAAAQKRLGARGSSASALGSCSSITTHAINLKLGGPDQTKKIHMANIFAADLVEWP